jgi:hypothetical protein
MPMCSKGRASRRRQPLNPYGVDRKAKNDALALLDLFAGGGHGSAPENVRVEAQGALFCPGGGPSTPEPFCAMGGPTAQPTHR